MKYYIEHDESPTGPLKIFAVEGARQREIEERGPWELSSTPQCAILQYQQSLIREEKHIRSHMLAYYQRKRQFENALARVAGPHKVVDQFNGTE
jgi:hypothetical protein